MYISRNRNFLIYIIIYHGDLFLRNITKFHVIALYVCNEQIISRSRRIKTYSHNTHAFTHNFFILYVPVPDFVENKTHINRKGRNIVHITWKNSIPTTLIYLIIVNFFTIIACWNCIDLYVSIFNTIFEWFGKKWTFYIYYRVGFF